MINVLKSGRLGNNLFQFAFGMVLSKKLKTQFIFDTESLNEYFELSNYNGFVLKRIRFIRYLLSLKFNKWKAADLNLNEEPNKILGLAENNTVIYGYFQSYLYFKGYEQLIKKAFQIKGRYLKNYILKFPQIVNKEIVCVAVRRTDYINWNINEIDDNTPELDFSYFKKALSLIPDLNSKNLVFISDDMEMVKKELCFDNAIYIHEEIEAFISLTLADHLIISNSSFHWWGAWLNSKTNKVVYVPKYWLGHKVEKEYPKDIIPPDWIQIKV